MFLITCSFLFSKDKAVVKDSVQLNEVEEVEKTEEQKPLAVGMRAEAVWGMFAR